jgi:formate hydrogenlyase subunit 3/multisubunit Na+/H+ antiporter MnhD subunit
MPGIALPATTGLWCVLGFLALAGLAIAVGGRRIATPLIYGGSLAVALVALGAALTCFLVSAPPWTLILPIGLPGIGARFRVDALSAFFLVVVNLGAAVTSLYALGYGRHEEAPARVLPFYAAFLGAMNRASFLPSILEGFSPPSRTLTLSMPIDGANWGQPGLLSTKREGRAANS